MPSPVSIWPGLGGGTPAANLAPSGPNSARARAAGLEPPSEPMLNEAASTGIDRGLFHSAKAKAAIPRLITP